MSGAKAVELQMARASRLGSVAQRGMKLER